MRAEGLRLLGTRGEVLGCRGLGEFEGLGLKCLKWLRVLTLRVVLKRCRVWGFRALRSRASGF